MGNQILEQVGGPLSPKGTTRRLRSVGPRPARQRVGILVISVASGRLRSVNRVGALELPDARINPHVVAIRPGEGVTPSRTRHYLEPSSWSARPLSALSGTPSSPPNPQHCGGGEEARAYERVIVDDLTQANRPGIFSPRDHGGVLKSCGALVTGWVSGRMRCHSGLSVF